MRDLEHLSILLSTEMSKTIVHLVMKFVIGMYNVRWCDRILLIAATLERIVTVHWSLRANGHWRQGWGIELWSHTLLLEHLLLLLLS
jgi:hypothetical protein